MPREDLVGQQFGKLTVLEYVGPSEDGSLWKCRCECGNIKTVIAHDLHRGSTTSCGCYRKLALRRRMRKPRVHGRLTFIANDYDE
jgi:hypothetical protein